MEVVKLNERIIEIENVSKIYRKDEGERKILNNINLSINCGEFVTIVGKSGCGKSTLLKIISGMTETSEGEVRIKGEKARKYNENCSIVFQESRLFPWLKIRENINIGLKNLSKREKDAKADEYMKLVGLKGYENSYPKELSGGMSQRAAIARGLIMDSDIILLDEPFGALDAMTKINMQEEVLKIRKEKKKTMILVTHDIEEAVYLGDRVIVLSSNPGEIRDIVNIEIEGIKDRTNSEFAYYKNMIYDYFFESQDENVEYKI